MVAPGVHRPGCAPELGPRSCPLLLAKYTWPPRGLGLFWVTSQNRSAVPI